MRRFSSGAYCCEAFSILEWLDDIETWGEFMATASTSLRIKYGLGNDPTSTQAAEWARLVRQYISNGLTREAAGERAAKYLFPDFRTHVYASEADTIDTLLRLVDEKK